MKRRSAVVAIIVAAPVLGMAWMVPAMAGEIPAAISASHAPDPFQLHGEGTFTITLTSNDAQDTSQVAYEVDDTVPATMSITDVDEGDYGCETDNTAHTVDCTITSDLEGPESFTIHVTPSQLGQFTDTA